MSVRCQSVALALFVLAGCASQVRLAPAPSSLQSTALPDAAFDSAAGVSVLIESQAWPGLPEIANKVVPIRVTIQNYSGELLRVRTSEFHLVGGSGKTYAALPPYMINGTISEPLTPGFTYYNFRLAPYWGYAYRDFPLYDGDFPYDAGYYDQYYPAWAQIALPTLDMLRLAMPDGVVADSGHVNGFLYFQGVSKDELTVKFTTTLINAGNGQSMGEISIPLTVVK